MSLHWLQLLLAFADDALFQYSQFLQWNAKWFESILRECDSKTKRAWGVCIIYNIIYTDSIALNGKWNWMRIKSNSLRCTADRKQFGPYSRRLISRTRLRILNLGVHLRCMEIKAIIYFNVNCERKTVWLAKWRMVFGIHIGQACIVIVIRLSVNWNEVKKLNGEQSCTAKQSYIILISQLVNSTCARPQFSFYLFLFFVAVVAVFSRSFHSSVQHFTVPLFLMLSPAGCIFFSR